MDRVGIGIFKSCVAALTLAVAACASDGDEVGPQAVTGQSASDVNWAFADTSAMQAKVASLQQENARLQRKLLQLERDLKDATQAAENAEQVAQAATSAAEAATARSAPKPAPAPVITAPNPARDLTNVDDATEVAPRLVQPTFAADEPSFENEAVAEEIELESVLWGVHLDSYRKEADARSGWKELQRGNPDELGLLEPRLENVTIAGQGQFLRLIAGGFSSEATARALCKTLSSKGQYCRVVGFSGARLSVADRS